MSYKFSFGKKSKIIAQWTVISLVLSFLVASLHKCSGVSENIIWDLIDVFQQHWIKKGIPIPSELNEQIIRTPELLDRRIKRDVDYAIQKYTKEERRLYKPNMKNKDILKEIEKPKYNESQRQIIKDAVYYECPDGTMGIHAIWYDSKKCNY